MVLSTLDAMTSSTGWISTAAMVGLEPLLDRVFQQASESAGLEVAVYVEALSVEHSARAEVQGRIAQLQQNPTLVHLQREAQRREAEQQLHFVRFLHAQIEPPEWVWETVPEEEQAQLRSSSEAREEHDPVLLGRVERALARVTSGTYGQCEDCGDPILTERLRLIPWAECCSRCQRRREGSPEAAPEPTIPVMRF
jgi:RNA polymerase-binding transcription factor DksA